MHICTFILMTWHSVGIRCLVTVAKANDLFRQQYVLALKFASSYILHTCSFLECYCPSPNLCGSLEKEEHSRRQSKNRHPSTSNRCVACTKGCGVAGVYPSLLWMESGVLPVHHRYYPRRVESAHSVILTSSLKSLINCTCKPMDCKRKLELLEGTH